MKVSPVQQIKMEASAASSEDKEMVCPPEQTVMDEPKHNGAPIVIDSNSSHASAPTQSDQVFSKLLCYTCSIGEVLGEVICGEHRMFFCCECQEGCGCGGKGGCLKCDSVFELFFPELRCGCFEKCFCIKCGCVSPLEKPFVVCLGKEIV